MRVPKMKTDLQKKSVFFEGFKLFNELPAELKECQSEDIFKRLLKMHCKTLFILNKYLFAILLYKQCTYNVL